MGGPSGRYSMGHPFIVLALEDLAELTITLRAAFPRVRFHASDEDPNVDWPATLEFRDQCRARGVPDDPFDPDNPLYKHIPKPSSQCRVPYVEGLEQTEVWARCCAWVEPEGWAPFWGLTERDYPVIVNEPELQFYLNYSHYGSSRTPLSATGDDKARVLTQGNWYGSHHDGKPHEKAFLAKVRRIFAKQTINHYSRVDRATGAVISRDNTGGPYRFGLRALDWARAHPKHFLAEQFKPYDWNPP